MLGPAFMDHKSVQSLEGWRTVTVTGLVLEAEASWLGLFYFLATSENFLSQRSNMLKENWKCVSKILPDHPWEL